MVKCLNCGFEGTRADFRWMMSGDGSTAISIRECPKCGKPVYVNDLDEDEENRNVEVWGSKILGMRLDGKKKQNTS